MESFLAYLTSDERELVNLSLNGKLDKEQENEWLDLLERFNWETVPKAKQVKDVVLEIAHKEVIQTPRYIVDSWSTPFSAFHRFRQQFSSTDCLLEMFARGKPTNKKIITFRRKPWDLSTGGIPILFETLFSGDRRWEINKVLKILYRLFVQETSRTHPLSSAESPYHISILSVVRGGMEQQIVLRVLGHWLCSNSLLNLHTRTALLLCISESLAFLSWADFYTIDSNWCNYTTSELFNGCFGFI